MQNLQRVIEQATDRADHSPSEKQDLAEAVLQVIALLDVGELRVAEKRQGSWHVNAWVKQAILCYFRQETSVVISGGVTPFFDKVPLKFSQATAADFKEQDIRLVPTALVRRGAYIAPQTVLMPCYVNIGAYIDSGSLIDTWATVSSCAQVGKNVHLSGGAGLGGVLEPINASPVIIEDNCFIGARAEIVEGVVVEEHAVIAMGVFIGQSTPIYHREKREVTYGRVPAGSVVVPGSLPAKDGTHSLACAVIVKQVDDRTRGRIALNEALRELAKG